MRGIKKEFAKANNDAYLALLRSGPYVVNIYKDTKTLDEDGNKKYELQSSEFFESRAEARKAAEAARSKFDNDYRIQDFKQILHRHFVKRSRLAGVGDQHHVVGGNAGFSGAVGDETGYRGGRIHQRVQFGRRDVTGYPVAK